MSRALATLALLLTATPALAGGFDWGGDCDDGSGTFSVALADQEISELGTIPAGKVDVFIELDSLDDIDVQLVDDTDETLIIGWPDGVVASHREDCADHGSMRVCYSGYNGGQTSATLGQEWIRITGETDRDMTLGVFAYSVNLGGSATVDYSYGAPEDCADAGSGSFSVSLTRSEARVLGTIPKGKQDLRIELESRADLDVQLLAEDGTTLIAWPSGLLSSHKRACTTWEGATLCYSGYNGDGHVGSEWISVSGEVPMDLQIGAFGYAAGTASVRYAWGLEDVDAAL